MSPKIKTLIVDDVELARNRVRMFLDSDPDIEIIGDCKNGREAISSIHADAPDLVFLDVQMPETSGFDVVEAVGVEKMPVVVFVTAYDEFALRAFEINAVDYLLKPFNKERFEAALLRAKRGFKREETSELDERLGNLLKQIKSVSEPKYLKRLPIKTSTHIFLIPTEEIIFFKAAGNYLEVNVKKEMYLIRESIGQIEKKLDPGKFARIHRSTIVNLDYIESLHPLFSGDYLVILRNGKELNLSRTYHKNLI